MKKHTVLIIALLSPCLKGMNPNYLEEMSPIKAEQLTYYYFKRASHFLEDENYEKAIHALFKAKRTASTPSLRARVWLYLSYAQLIQGNNTPGARDVIMHYVAQAKKLAPNEDHIKTCAAKIVRTTKMAYKSLPVIRLKALSDPSSILPDFMYTQSCSSLSDWQEPRDTPLLTRSQSSSSLFNLTKMNDEGLLPMVKN